MKFAAMLRLVLSLWLFILPACYGIHITNAAELSAKGTNLSFDPANGRIDILRNSKALRGTIEIEKGGIDLVDGRTGSKISQGPIQNFKATANQINFDRLIASHGIKVGNLLKGSPSYLSWKVEVNNTGKEQQWLQIRLVLPLHSSNGAVFWNGQYERKYIIGKYDTPDIFGLPLSAVYSTQRGIALGIEPHMSLSYLENG
ncbi:MAG: hypothetical protein PHT33_11165, partial [bacterium]|nr:hypothetical protein [bacterium]